MSKLRAKVTFTLEYDSEEEVGKRFLARTLEGVAGTLLTDGWFWIGDGEAGVSFPVENEGRFNVKILSEEK